MRRKVGMSLEISVTRRNPDPPVLVASEAALSTHFKWVTLEPFTSFPSESMEVVPIHFLI